MAYSVNDARRSLGRCDILVLDTAERGEIVGSNEQAKSPYNEKTIII